jgi:tripartite-type tricarboxylate transporter receptor subunit TctC
VQLDTSLLLRRVSSRHTGPSPNLSQRFEIKGLMKLNGILRQTPPGEMCLANGDLGQKSKQISRTIHGHCKDAQREHCYLVPSYRWRSVMRFARRQFLRLIGAVAVAFTLPHIASALDYPTRPVRLIVPYGAGSSPDLLVRLLGQWLSERLGQPFIIENRPGGAANLGTEAVVHAPADGYTLLVIGAANMINPSLYEKLNFNFIRDIAPVASVGRGAHVIAVNPSVPVNSISELIAFARANPGRLNEGSATGTSPHLAAELFKAWTGINIVHVPYRSGPAALPDLLTGQLQVSFDLAGVLAESIRAGKLRALAVTTSVRWNGLPEVPSVSDSLPGFEVASTGGIGAPRGTPFEIIEKLNREINAALADDAIRTRIADLGSIVPIGTLSDFAKLIASETEKWGKAIRAANIKTE